MDDAKRVSCPSCKREIPWSAESAWRPFCSERCRLIDLGDWFAEKRRIAEDVPNEPQD